MLWHLVLPAFKLLDGFVLRWLTSSTARVFPISKLLDGV
jgi:hypothetical protein